MHVDTLSAAVEQALRAPSVHNTQPWRWRVGPDAVLLYADLDRHLAATDPDTRDLVMSCGAALHHLLVALARAGVQARVDRVPDPDDRTLLAAVTVRRGAGLAADPALAAAIAERRTDRRRMSSRPVPPALLRKLTAHGRRAGAVVLGTGPAQRARLVDALVDGARAQQSEAGYVTELAIWTHRYAGAHDGIDPGSIARTPLGGRGPSPLRQFPGGRLAQAPVPLDEQLADDAAELLVVTTAGDGPVDRLRAGEATSAVLLAATRAGLATTPLSQGLEVDTTRHAVRCDVLHTPEHPQLVLRVGWPAPGAPLVPPTPRRPLRSVLLRS